MKKFLAVLTVILTCSNFVLADEVVNENPSIATQEIQASDNKIIVVVQKQPLNENSKQVVTLKKNWFGVYIQVNGKVKIQPLTNTYEVE